MAGVAKDETKAKAPTGGTAETKVKTFADVANEKLDGFERDDQPSIDGWYKPVAGDGFYGRVIGHFQIKGKKIGESVRDVVLVRLGVACNGIVDKKAALLTEGQVLGVSIRHKLLPLMEHITNKNVVRVVAIEQVSIGGGQSMWNFKIESKGVKAPPPAPRQLTHDQAAAGGVVGDDDIPF